LAKIVDPNIESSSISAIRIVYTF